MISDLLQRIGVSEFPDNEHNKWTLLETLHVGRRRYARAEAEPNDVGYDSFVFVFRFADGDQAFVTQAICSEEGGKYHLLATTEHCGEPFPRIVAW